jgi:hypothetical protein
MGSARLGQQGHRHIEAGRYEHAALASLWKADLRAMAVPMR